MNGNDQMNQNQGIPKMIKRFRNQALYIKTNIQVLQDIWDLQPEFKAKKTGAFYKITQDNCIFRIILEMYKMLYDSKGNSITIFDMANTSYNSMIQSPEFKGRKQELLDKKKKLSADLKKYDGAGVIIKGNRNKVYAHNDSHYHWFNNDYIEKWGMEKETYDQFMEMMNICIEYCNDILRMFHQKPVYEYSNHDDVKYLFELQTDADNSSK